MTYRGLACLLLAALAWGQAAKPTPSPAPKKPAATARTPSDAAPPDGLKLRPDAAVITIEGLCEGPPVDKAAASGCKTVVTRAQFESLVNVVAPTLPPSARRQFANRYAMALIMAQEAHKMGLDKGPRYEDLVRLSHLQVLAQELSRSLQEKAAQISDKEIEDYYHNNAAAYEEANVQRLLIPKAKQLEASKENLSEADTQKREQEAEAAMKSEADALRARATAGEDLGKLQKESYEFAGLKTTPPNINMGKIRRTSLPAGHASVMDLKPGETSQVISDPTGYFVYKVGDKDTIPLDKVRQDIQGTMRAKRFQDSMQAVQQSATPSYDENYFGAPATPAPAGGAKPTLQRPTDQPPAPEPK